MVIPGSSDTVKAGTTDRRTVLRIATFAVAASTLPGATRAQDDHSQDVGVFPRPGALTASPGTQITFRGVKPAELGSIRVTGDRSGEHPGTFVAHADVAGVSWLPDFPFRPGETVTVRTSLSISGADGGVYAFTCVVPRAPRAAPPMEETPSTAVRAFRSRPDLAPPDIRVERYGEVVAPGVLFVAPKRGSGRNGALILYDSGEPVWFHPVENELEEISDLKVVDYRGQPALVWWQGINVFGHGFGHWVVLDSTYQQVATIRIANGYAGGDVHDILFTESHTAIIVAYNTVAWDTTDVGGTVDGNVVDSVVQEIDLTSGAVLFEWHSLDDVALDESYSAVEPDDPGGDLDYVHVNSVALDPDGNLLICARNTWAVYAVDRRTGDIRWRLGGRASDFAMGDGAQFAYQHDARPLPNGELSLFDNGAAPPVHEQSRGLVLTVDKDAMRITVAREYVHPDRPLSSTQGNMQVLPNGNVLVGWGSEPLTSEFSADGALLLDVRLPEGLESYRALRLEWSADPQAPPDLAVERDDEGMLTAYVSWNGATDVAAWRILGGPSADNLAAIGDDVPRSGFETEIRLSSTALYLAADAIDAAGRQRGRTLVVDLGEAR